MEQWPRDLGLNLGFFIAETLGLWADHFAALGFAFFQIWKGSFQCRGLVIYWEFQNVILMFHPLSITYYVT